MAAAIVSTPIPDQFAAAFLGPGGLARWLRDIAGQNPELDVLGLRLTLAARRYTDGARQTAHPGPPIAGPAEDGWVSSTEAARALGLHRATVDRAIVRGELRAEWIGGRRVIRLSDLTAYGESRAA
jgi:excisionase family DNA binding protein